MLSLFAHIFRQGLQTSLTDYRLEHFIKSFCSSAYAIIGIEILIYSSEMDFWKVVSVDEDSLFNTIWYDDTWFNVQGWGMVQFTGLVKDKIFWGNRRPSSPD